MKILLTGSNGQLGRCFQDQLPEDWQCLALDSSQLDISDPQAVLDKVGTYQPDVIVNAAAYTAVDKAESEASRAAAVNADGPENLALAAKAVGARLFHVSTDYVFDGQGDKPYRESDAVNPLGVYGTTKLAGEQRVLSALPQAVILRTAWVFSEYGNNFVKTMLRLGQQRPELTIVADQYGCPTYAGDIAAALIAMIKQSAAGGIYHYCGDLAVSWAQFAEQIFKVACQQNFISRAPTVTPITTAEFPTAAQRPAYSVLATEKVSQFYPASNWRSALEWVFSQLKPLS